MKICLQNKETQYIIYNDVKKLDIYIIDQKILWTSNISVCLYWTKLSIPKETKDTSGIIKKDIILLVKAKSNKRIVTIQVSKQVSLKASIAPN